MANIGKEIIEKAKGNIIESLENNFIENINAVKKEMNLLNLLIESFTENKYTYNEYCSCRMKFEVEACERVIDFDFEEEMKINNQEMTIIQNRASRKSIGKTDADYEELIKEEFIKWQLEKCQRLDKKMFYKVAKYSYIKLLKEKISEDVWNDKKKYFEDICEDKANKYGEAVAAANKERHEQDIRSSYI